MNELQHAGFSSFNIIGEVTEAIQRRLLDNYDITDRPPRMEEDLKFVPKDREEVIYLYMYRVAQNPALQRQKRFQPGRAFGGRQGRERLRKPWRKPPAHPAPGREHPQFREPKHVVGGRAGACGPRGCRRMLCGAS